MAATGAEKPQNSRKTAGLPRVLAREMTGDVFFDAFNRGRYATDASFYQILPRGVVVPRTMDEALRALSIAGTRAWSSTPRGGGTSQCGQTVNEGIVVDFSKHLNRILSLDVENRICVVEPGIVLDDLNRQLKKHGLWFPVDVSTASRATIGGMAGNNSCGGRSLRYGTMRDNTLSMDAALADGTLLHFGEVPRDLARVNSPRAGLRCSGTCSISASARPRKYRSGFQRCSAASAATISMRWCRAMRRTTWRICWSAPRHAGLHHAGRTQAVACDPATRCSASAISAVFTRRWMRRSIW
jgi:FAD/FMN-containing dehydrogenase